MTTARLRSVVFMVGVVTAALFLALAGGASATTYCVHDPACSATGTTEPTIQAGLNAAGTHVGPDTVKVGPGTYSSMGGYGYTSGNGSVALIGAGSGQTKLTNPGDPNNPDDVLTVTSGPGSSVQDLRVVMPLDSTFTLFGDEGLVLNGARADGVVVTAPSGAQLDWGVDMSGKSSFTNGSVILPQSGLGPNTAIVNRNLGLVFNSTLEGTNGIDAVGSLIVTRAHILTGSGFGVRVTSGAVSVHNSLIYLGSFAGATGLSAVEPGPNQAVTMVVHADHVTVAGGGPGSTGLEARATAPVDNGHQTATATLSNSTISGPETSIDREAKNTSTTSPGTSTANVTTSYSNYGAFKQKNVNGANGAGSTTPGHFVAGTPAFAPGANDFRPAAGSILVDSGDPHFTGGTDLLGNPRVLDGDGDGVAITDLGAYERK